MKPPADYVRVSLFLAGQPDTPLTAEQAEAMLGQEMDVSLRPAHPGYGTVLDVRLLDGGRRVRLSVERGGRSCTVCRRVFTEQDAPVELTRADTFADESAKPHATWAAVYRILADWSPVCRNWATCRRVQLSNVDGDPLLERDDEGADTAAAGATP